MVLEWECNPIESYNINIMKAIKIFLGVALAAMTLAACENKEDQLGEVDYAERATIASSSSEFTATDDGGTIDFKAAGGEVVITVDCEIEWTANNYSDAFEAVPNVSAGTLTVTAEQNLVAEKQSGTIVLVTSESRIQFAAITVTQNAYGAPEITVEPSEWNAPAAGELTTLITVDCSLDDFEISNTCSWLTVEKADGGVQVTAGENTETEQRSDSFTLTCTDGYNSDSATVTVTQDAHAGITLSSDTVTVNDEAGTRTVTVESNYDWDYSYETTLDWISVAREDNDLTISVTANETGEDRTCIVTVTAGDGAENVCEAQLTVTQTTADPATMILVYTIAPDDSGAAVATTVTLPFSDGVNCTIDWGDGSDPETVTSTFPAHTYTAAGDYKVRIDGTVTALNGKSLYSYSTYDYTLTSVVQWGELGLTSVDYAFYHCKGLVSIPAVTGDVFAGLTSFNYFFSDCAALESVPADLFAASVDATSFEGTFESCKALKEIPAGLFDNNTKVESFSGTFYECTAITSIPDALFANCPEVTCFDEVFRACSSLESLPSDLFANNAKVKSFDIAFFKCVLLTTLPEDLFAGCPDVESFSETFENCSGLTFIPEGLFASNTKATDFSCEFYGTAITAIPPKLFVKNTAAECFTYLFDGCSSLESIPEGLFDTNVNVDDFSLVFSGCSKITEIPSGLFANNTAAETFGSAFYGCSGITSIPKDLFSTNTEVTNFSSVFRGCTGITSIPEELFANNTKVTNFGNAFRGCTALTTVPEKLFAACPAVTTFTYTFAECTALTSIPAGIFDGNLKVTTFSYTFYSSTNLACESPYTTISDGTNVHLYERSSHTDVFSKPSTTTKCFNGCESLTDYSAIPSGWR